MIPLASNCVARSTAGRRDRYRFLRCEPLEDRRMLSVLFVDDDVPTGGDGLAWSSAFDDLENALLRAGVVNADADASNDVDAIWIAEGVYTPSGRGGSGFGRDANFFLTDGVTLYGGFEGTETTLEDRGDDLKMHETVLSGDIGMPNDAWDNVCTVVFCHTRVTAGLDGLTITGGYDVGAYSLGDEVGGGISSLGTLTVSNCTITGNTAETGGGLWNAGTMWLIDSTVEGNTALIEGGGIFNEGTLEIERSTISSNESGSIGGGISNHVGNLTIVDSSVSGNTIRGHIDAASNYGAGIHNMGDMVARGCEIVRNVINAYVAGSGEYGNYGGGIANWGDASVTGTLVAGNHVAGSNQTAGNQGAGIWNAETGDLSLTNATVTYNVYDFDLFGEITNDGALTLRNSIVYSDRYGELGGCGTVSTSNSLIGIDPLFADPYASDFRLTAASPAINIGNSAFVDGSLSAEGCPIVETDLDGSPRVYGESVDVGAYEFQADPPGGRETPSTCVTMWEDVFDPYDGAISLREAIWYAEDDPETTITFDEEFERFRCSLDCSALLIDRSLTIDASSLEYCRIDAGGDSRALLVVGGEDCEVTLKGVTIRRGIASHGGGIYNTATLVLEDAFLEGNDATSGGGVFNLGTLVAHDSVFGGNDARWSEAQGGAIYNAGDLELIDVVIDYNDAGYGEGGAIYNHGTADLVNTAICHCEAGYGGAIFNSAMLHVTNSAFSACRAFDDGGALYADLSHVVLRNSTITACEARSGGGVFISDRANLDVQNTIIAKNSAMEQGPDVASPGGVLSGSYNLIGDGSGQTALLGGVDGNLVGTADAPIDPVFLCDPDRGADGIWGTSDDDAGDLGLRWTSPAIDAGNISLLPADTYDLDGDGDTAEPLPVDLEGNARTQDGTVNIGAIERITFNSRPTAEGDAYTLAEDERFVVDGGIGGVLDNDADVDGDFLTAILLDDVDHGILRFNENGTFVYQAVADWSGEDSFTYQAYDGAEHSSVVTVTLTVQPANDAPILDVVPDQMVDAGVTVEFTLSGTDTDGPFKPGSSSSSGGIFSWLNNALVGLTNDPDSPSPTPIIVPVGSIIPGSSIFPRPSQPRVADLTFSAVNLPEGASLDSETGVFSWPTQTTQVGEYDVTFIGTDKGTPPMSDSWTVHISVLEPHAVPVLHPEPEITEGFTNTVSWDPVPGCTEYWVQCDDDPEFGSVEMESGWIDTTSFTFTSLHPYTTYYYRVKTRHRLRSPAEYTWEQTTQADFEREGNTGVGVDTDSFPGRVTLAETGALYQETFEDGSLEGWIVESDSCLCEITDGTAAEGAFSLSVAGSDGSPFGGAHADLRSIRPTEVRFSVRSDDATMPGGRLVLASGPSDVETVVSFEMGREDAPGTMGVFDGRQWHGVPFITNQWYDVKLRLNWFQQTIDFYIDDVPMVAGISFLATGVTELNGLYLSGREETSQTWWDNLTATGGQPAGIGVFTSETIVPEPGAVWDSLAYDVGATPFLPGQATISILPETGDTPIPGFESVYPSADPSGGLSGVISLLYPPTDLSRLPNEPIRLRVVLSGAGGFEPALNSWSISWNVPEIYADSNWSAPVFSFHQQVLGGPVLVVDADAAGTNDGSCWEDAFTDLQDALDFAGILNSDTEPQNDVSQIWIAEGTYRPSEPITGSDTRAAAFSMVDGVNLYGGFAGTETSTTQRSADPSEFETILSGDIGVNGDDEDNAYSVVYCGAGVKAGLDGVTVTGGNANGGGNGNVGGGNNSGGGIRNKGILEVSNSRIVDNRASRYAAGIYTGCETTPAVLTMRNSIIAGNETGGWGGAIYNEGDRESARVVVENTLFTGNRGNSAGGAILNAGTLDVSDCTFLDNLANTEQCAGIQNWGGSACVVDSTFEQNVVTGHNVLWNSTGGGVGSMEIVGCTLLETVPVETYHGCTLIVSGASDGGHSEILLRDTTIIGCEQAGSSAMSFGAGEGGTAVLTVDGCTFTRCTDRSGGAVTLFSRGGDVEATFIDSTFTDNVAEEDGGAIGFDVRDGDVHATVESCLFERNSALGRGGAIYSGTVRGTAGFTVVDSQFANNRAGAGGAVYSAAAASVRGSVFTGNMAGGNGGAVFNLGTATVAGSAFSGNTAGFAGGAVYSSGKLDMNAATIAGNEAGRFGGGIQVFGVSADVALRNCLIAQNDSGYRGPEVFCSKGILAGSNNLIGNGSDQAPLANGTDGNIVGTESVPIDPLFVRSPSKGTDGTWGTPDDDYGDLRLREGSPAIDSGSGAGLPSDAVDLDGTPRVYNGTLDIGAYEFHFGDGDLNGDGVVNGEDLNIIQTNWERQVPAGVVSLGDPNGDGVVDRNDLDIVRANWGNQPAATVEMKPVEKGHVVASATPSRAVQAAATDAAIVSTAAERPQTGLSESDLASLAEAAWMRELEARRGHANKRAATVMPVWRTV